MLKKYREYNRREKNIVSELLKSDIFQEIYKKKNNKKENGKNE